MLGRTEQRRVLLVVSDGSPMDTATKLANDGFYLDNHLQAVVSELRRRHGVEVYGLGVGLDLRPYYERCIELDLSAGISNRVFDEFIGMIARP
jgi:cobaltochelatase CobT